MIYDALADLTRTLYGVVGGKMFDGEILSTDVEGLLNLREIGQRTKDIIDSDDQLDTWISVIKNEDIARAFDNGFDVPSNALVRNPIMTPPTKEEVNLYVLKKAIEAQKYYFVFKDEIDADRAKEFAEREPNPRRRNRGDESDEAEEAEENQEIEELQEPAVAGFALIDGFVSNHANYRFNSVGLQAKKDDFNNKVDYLFVENGYINDQNSQGQTALAYELAHDQSHRDPPYGRMRYLLLNRADLLPEAYKQAESIDDDNGDLGKLLVDMRVSVDYGKDPEKHSNLVDIVKMFVERGANLSRTQYGFLQIVQFCENLTTVKLLIDHGIELNSLNYMRGVNGTEDIYATSLFSACYGGCLEMIKLLYNRGARFDTYVHREAEESLTFDGRHILTIIISNTKGSPGWHDTWNNLLKFGRDSTPRNDRQRMELLRTIVNYGARIDSVDGEGEQHSGIVTLVLQTFPSSGSKIFVEELLTLAREKGLDSRRLIDYADSRGYTALLIIARTLTTTNFQDQEYLEAFKNIHRLLEWGADPTILKKFSFTDNTLYDEIAKLTDKDPINLINKYLPAPPANPPPAKPPPANPPPANVRQPIIVAQPANVRLPQPVVAPQPANVRQPPVNVHQPQPVVPQPQPIVNVRQPQPVFVPQPVVVPQPVFVPQPVVVPQPVFVPQPVGVHHQHVRQQHVNVVHHRTDDEIIRAFMAVNGIQPGARGGVTEDVLRQISHRVDVRGWSTQNGSEAKKFFIANKLFNLGF